MTAPLVDPVVETVAAPKVEDSLLPQEQEDVKFGCVPIPNATYLYIIITNVTYIYILKHKFNIIRRGKIDIVFDIETINPGSHGITPCSIGDLQWSML